MEQKTHKKFYQEPRAPFQKNRVRTAPSTYIRLRPILQSVDNETIQKIKKSAKETWKHHIEKNIESRTTYEGLHTSKVLDEPTKNRMRPSSKYRINRPHPEEVFLYTRLNEIDGCFNPKEEFVKRYGGVAQQNLDRFVSQNRKEIKHAMKASPLQRPYSSLEYQPDRQVMMKTIMGHIPKSLTYGWINSNGRKGIVQRRAVAESMKTAKVQTKRIFKDGVFYHIVDYAPPRTKLTKPPFYDFQIHPEWHMSWHKKYDTFTRS